MYKVGPQQQAKGHLKALAISSFRFSAWDANVRCVMFLQTFPNVSISIKNTSEHLNRHQPSLGLNIPQCTAGRSVVYWSLSTRRALTVSFWDGGPTLAGAVCRRTLLTLDLPVDFGERTHPPPSVPCVYWDPSVQTRRVPVCSPLSIIILPLMDERRSTAWQASVCVPQLFV